MATDQTPGPRDDGVDIWVADASVIDSHTQASQTVAQMPVPQLVSSTTDSACQPVCRLRRGSHGEINHYLP